MKGRVFYIPGYHKLVYCHDEKEGMLILGGMTFFITDCKRNIIRQEISKIQFEKYKPILIDEYSPEQYHFLKISNCHYRVIEVSQTSGYYFKQSTKLINSKL